MSPREALESLVLDVGKLADDYGRAGLLGSAGPDRAARSLVGDAAEVMAFRRLFLLTDALLRNVVGKKVFAAADAPRHVAVFGGTNVGKSTCVNVLLAAGVAGVRHTAAFTRHAQAFVPPGVSSADLFGGDPFAFRRFAAVPIEKLRPDVLDQYGVVVRPSSAPLPGVIVWDTPDCDSVDSQQYMAAVVEAVTIADAVVYVTTGQKYAVDFMLEWVILLERAGTPLLGCLNLTKRKDQPEILENQKLHLDSVAARNGVAAPRIDMVGFFVANEDEADLYKPEHAPGGQLREKVVALLNTASSGERVRRAVRFALASLKDVLGPARAELEAASRWRSAVDEAAVRFTADYETNYINDPKRFDAFRRLNLELLDLLDPNIPGLKQGLQVIRTVLRLPSQIIITVGKWIYNAMFGGGDKKKVKLPPEAESYQYAHTALLQGLTDLISRMRAEVRRHPFWDELDARWGRELSGIQQEFADKLKAHFDETERRIKEAARDIFKALEKSPVLLNTLRTARISVDAGMIVFAVVTAGHTTFVHDLLHDFIVAPSADVGGAGGGGLHRRQVHRDPRAQLKSELLDDARHFADEVYRDRLRKLGEELIAAVGFLRVDAALVNGLPDRLEALAKMLEAPGDVT